MSRSLCFALALTACNPDLSLPPLDLELVEPPVEVAVLAAAVDGTRVVGVASFADDPEGVEYDLGTVPWEVSVDCLDGAPEVWLSGAADRFVASLRFRVLPDERRAHAELGVVDLDEEGAMIDTRVDLVDAGTLWLDTLDCGTTHGAFEVAVAGGVLEGSFDLR